MKRKMRSKEEKAWRAEYLLRKKQERAQAEKDVISKAIDDARTDGYGKGYDAGSREATASIKNSAFSDLGDAWSQVQRQAQAASIYAGIIASMYRSQTSVEKTDTKEGK